MINKGKELIQAKEFNIGLYTRSDIVNANPDLTPNCMDIQWLFDNSIAKRLGSSTMNTTALAGAISSGFSSGVGSLTNNLIAYWKLNEATGNRADQVGTSNLVNYNSVTSAAGIISGAALFISADSQILQVNTSDILAVNSSGIYSISTWIYKTATDITAGGQSYILSSNTSNVEVFKIHEFNDEFAFTVLNVGSSQRINSSIGFGSANFWYNVIAWFTGGVGGHIGISVNGIADTASLTIVTNTVNGTWISVGGTGINSGGASYTIPARIDETGIWNRVLTSTERTSLYNSGSGNTYNGGALGFGWASFDFGAGTNRWYTVAAGTGIFASTDLGRTFTAITTSARAQTFQYLERSRNVLIATSDAYDDPMYWAGSAGTFMVTMALNSAPGAKYSNNYQGFCILLNSQDSNGVISNRRFNYADENLQLTSDWTDFFDLPSSSDDEITGSFILNKFLYVSTRYLLFRLNYTGGNPDWQYIQVKNFGYVPRTVQVFTLKQGQVAVGLDWNRRLRAFDGYDDQILSDNIENDNNYCDFAMSKISLGGSGLTLSHSVFDPNTQEYRLNVSIGANSSSISHAILLNARTLSLYPYSNQNFSTMCVAQSGGQQFVMAVDKEGRAHILNSGNLDINVAVNEVYDSPLLFNKAPTMVTKNQNISLYFERTSSGTIYYQERFDFSNVFSPMRPIRNYLGEAELKTSESALQLIRTVDLPSVQNIYQFRLTSSASTANPWSLTNFDLLNTTLGYGRAK